MWVRATLHVQDAKTAGAAWITAQGFPIGGLIPDIVRVTIDPKGLTPGTYSDSVAITSNAVAYTGTLGDKISLTVPVDLEIVSAGAPVVDFQGVLDNAIFVPGDAIARGDIVAVKGQQLSMMAPATGTAPPLSTQVADTQVLLNGVPIPLFYTSYGQINCQIPTDAPTGIATLQVKRSDGQASNLVTVTIGSRAPRLLRFNIGDYGAIVNGQDGSYPLPEGAIPGVNTHPARPGDTLIIYAIGLGDTNPVRGHRRGGAVQSTGAGHRHAYRQFRRRDRRRGGHSGFRRPEPHFGRVISDQRPDSGTVPEGHEST